jgi:hypothetical protein
MQYRDLHIFIEGLAATLEWPMLKVEPMYDGISFGAFGDSCVVKEFPSTTAVTVMTIDDEVACLHGSPEIQTIVVSALSETSGYFYVYAGGEKSGAISVNAEASAVEDALNAMLSLSDMSVTKHFLGEDINNHAWVVTFPPVLGDVESLVIDDQNVMGVDVGIDVYPMVNISMVADKDDISGHFRIAIGDESTIPLTWDVTDAALLNALHNLTNVGKVTMLGYSRDLEPAVV